MIRNCSKEYKHQRIPISTQRYKDVGVMDKPVSDITDSLRHQTHKLTTSDVSDIDGISVVELRGLNIGNHFLIKNYPWMNMIITFKNNWMISMTRKRAVSYNILVVQTVISLLLMFLCLIMVAVCLSILSFMIKI